MAKKDFSGVVNPALQFIDVTPAEPPVSPETEKSVQPAKAKGDALESPGKERKTKRLNLLVRPSIMEDLGKIAVMQRTSVNDLINVVLSDYVREKEDMVQAYAKVFEKDS